MTRACPHARGWPCPWPGCHAGTAAAQLVVCGVGGAKYFTRGFVVVDGRVVVAWVKREREGRVAA